MAANLGVEQNTRLSLINPVRDFHHYKPHPFRGRGRPLTNHSFTLQAWR
jgi:hypothetical protein